MTTFCAHSCAVAVEREAVRGSHLTGGQPSCKKGQADSDDRAERISQPDYRKPRLAVASLPGSGASSLFLTVKRTVKPMPQVLKANGDNNLSAQEMIEWE